MTFSPETSALGARYQVLYGFSQGLTVSAVIAGLAYPFEAVRPWVPWLLLAVSWIVWVLWRRSWRRYSAAMEADTQAALEELRELYRG